MSTWDAAELAALQRALDDFDQRKVHVLCRRFVDHIKAGPGPASSSTGLPVLEMLQRKRYVGLVQDVAEALLAHGTDTVEVRHRYALALVDHDRTAAAEALLTQLPEQVRKHDSEVQGAIGRVHKQRYVTSGPAAGRHRELDIAHAIDAYLQAYRHDPVGNRYHGINTAALLIRASDDGVSLDDHGDPRAEAVDIAQGILVSIAGEKEPHFWECGTAAEACLVVGDHDGAVEWLARYVGSHADAFEYASTLRQFEQVWRLDSHSNPGRRLIPVLRNRLLQAEGGSLSVSPSECTPESLQRFDEAERTLRSRSGDQHYEKVFGWDRFQPLGWLRDALVTCRSVARLEDSYGNGCGTGFVLAGNDIRPEWPARVLLTNAHVVPDTVDPDDAYISFRGLADESPEATRVQPEGGILWHSSKHQLDACFMALPGDLGARIHPLGVRRSFPMPRPDTRVRAYVIGHPLGSPEVQLSLHDSLVLGVGDVFAHYRSPTEAGSSGSPVFDDRWRVIALHHGWSDNLPGSIAAESGSGANEGIRLDFLLSHVSAATR
jgi:hypothetical protein